MFRRQRHRSDAPGRSGTRPKFAESADSCIFAAGIIGYGAAGERIEERPGARRPTIRDKMRKLLCAVCWCIPVLLTTACRTGMSEERFDGAEDYISLHFARAETRAEVDDSGAGSFTEGGPDRTVHRQRRDGKLPRTDPHVGRVTPAAEAQRIRDGRSDPRGALPRPGQCGGESPRPGTCAARRADRRKRGRDRSTLRPHDPCGGQLPHDTDLPARAAPPARSARRRVRRSGAPHPEPAARPHRPADG